ncbi:single-stranded DNA-binding protein [Vacuolonema iberomarrocanum]|uniref:single-stranded DNA-binding protein n=1 Tax=Vacuolonema iberomarrocanum TaxID=3454632 RepID=UPI0019F671D3|nr:single-stranded DNA-binding protein [filamentous cyanobacterium LEGE 07170]
MNNFIVMAEIVQEPQLRYTSDTQIPVTEMMVQFDGVRDSDPASKLKIVAWRDLAQEVQEKYHTGDRVILEGRLTMLTVDRPEGFKEKRAEMTLSRLHRVTGDGSLMSSAPAAAPRSTAAPQPAPSPEPAPASQPAAATAEEPVDYDDIPF